MRPFRWRAWIGSAAVLLFAGWMATGCGTIDTLEDIEPNDTEPGVYVEWPVGACDFQTSESDVLLLVGQVGGDDDPADHFAIIGTSVNHPVQIDGMTTGIETCALRTTTNGYDCASGDGATEELILSSGETLIFRVISEDGSRKRYQVKLRCPI